MYAAALAAVLALALTMTAGASGAFMSAMRSNPCPPAKPGDGVGSAFLNMLLTPGAHFVRLGQSPAERQAGERAAAQQRARDWADVCRYSADDAALHSNPRVVLMGDSITDFWRQGDPELFGHGIVDRGISGQTTSQMVVRFWPDVIALHPRIVQILAGTNDIAGNTGLTTEQDFKNNIMAMVDLAESHNMRVLLGSILPAAHFWWTPHPYRPAEEIRRLNDWLRSYAGWSAGRVEFVDYYSHLSTPAGAFRPDLSNDGVHPNAAGYKVMTSVLQAALAK